MLELLYDSVLRPKALDAFLRQLADDLRADVRISTSHRLDLGAGARLPPAGVRALSATTSASGLRMLGPASVGDGTAAPAFLTAVRFPPSPAFGRDENRLFSGIVSHVRRAMALRSRAAGLDPAVNPLAQATDQLTIGVLLLRAGGAVLFANREARRLLESRDGLALTATGLQLANRSEDRKLRLLIDAASRRPFNRASSGLAASRPSMSPPLLLEVVPASSPGPRPKGNAGMVVVFVRDPSRPALPQPADLVEAFRLTPAQATLAVRLCSGGTLAQAAASAGVALNTARVHLKALFRKTRTRRQAELVGLLLRTGESSAVGVDSDGAPAARRR